MLSDKLTFVTEENKAEMMVAKDMQLYFAEQERLLLEKEKPTQELSPEAQEKFDAAIAEAKARHEREKQA